MIHSSRWFSHIYHIQFATYVKLPKAIPRWIILNYHSGIAAIRIHNPLHPGCSLHSLPIRHMVQLPDSSCDLPHGSHVGCPSETSSTQRWCQPMSTRVGGYPLLPNIPANIWWWNLYPNHLQYIVSFNWSFSLVKIASRRSVSWRILLRSWKLHWKCHVLKEERQKHPAGAGMERVGVSNSLLGTFEQHWDLPVILSLAMMKNV